MYIDTVSINNYKNFYKTTIKLNKNINIVIGPNNIGKSNFLKLIHFLSVDPNKYGGGVDDFNKNNLFKNFMDYIEHAPVIEITYTIKHYIKDDDEDTVHGFSKIIHFIVYDSNGEPKKVSNDTFENTAIIKLRYEIDPRYNDDYKKEMRGVKDYKDYFNRLKRFEKRYEWKFFDNNDNEVNRNVVNAIFSVQYVEATRVIEEVSVFAKRNVNKKIKDHNIDEESIRVDVTKLFNEKCESIINEINDEIEIDQKKIGIVDGKNEFVSTFDYRGNIEDSFKYELKNADIDAPYSLPLENNGLGYNNLIYIRNLIKDIDTPIKGKSEYKLLLLEEPEAHLHPNMQYKLINYIRTLIEENNDKEQIIITTHSPNISASANIGELMLLYEEKEKVFNINAIQIQNLFEVGNYSIYNLEKDKEKELDGLLKKARKHLMKFLDVTRSDILFSTKIILVEGIAEKLLIPKFFPNLENYHIIIIELGGINFNHFLPLTINTNKKVLCITDLDFKYYKEENGVEKTIDIGSYNKKTNKNIANIFIDELDNRNLMVVKQEKGGNTFETELLMENYDNNEAWEVILDSVDNMPDIIKEICKLKSYKDCQDILCNSRKYKLKLNVRKVVERYIKIFNDKYQKATDDKKVIYEKLFFVNLVYHYVVMHKGEFALNLLNNESFNKIKIPEYIKKGVEWLI